MKLPKSLAVLFLAAVTSCTNPQGKSSQNNTASTSNEPPAPTCTPTYAVDVHLSQSRVSLDLWEHAKDAMNAADFSIPVSRELYRELHEGDDIVNSFRGGSLVFSGSWGSTHLKVEDMPEVCTTADTTSYEVTLKLKQSRLSLDIGQHFKDAANAVEFKWRVPGDVYKGMHEGDDLIQNGFRMGSFITKGSVGNWHLTVKEKNGLYSPGKK